MVAFNFLAKDPIIKLGGCSAFGSAFCVGCHGHYLVSFISTRLRRGPGTEPLTPITAISLSTKATLRRLVVTRWWPIWPAIFLPGLIFCRNIEPIDPGRR